MTQPNFQFSDRFLRLLKRKLSRRWEVRRNQSDLFFTSLKCQQRFTSSERRHSISLPLREIHRFY